MFSQTRKGKEQQINNSCWLRVWRMSLPFSNPNVSRQLHTHFMNQHCHGMFSIKSLQRLPYSPKMHVFALSQTSKYIDIANNITFTWPWMMTCLLNPRNAILTAPSYTTMLNLNNSMALELRLGQLAQVFPTKSNKLKRSLRLATIALGSQTWRWKILMFLRTYQNYRRFRKQRKEWQKVFKNVLFN